MQILDMGGEGEKRHDSCCVADNSVWKVFSSSMPKIRCHSMCHPSMWTRKGLRFSVLESYT